MRKSKLQEKVKGEYSHWIKYQRAVSVVELLNSGKYRRKKMSWNNIDLSTLAVYRSVKKNLVS